MSSEGYDVSNSRLAADTISQFLSVPLDPDITKIPGVGPATASRLAELEGDDKCTTAHQLLGKYLQFYHANSTHEERCDAMWFWFEHHNIGAPRNSIVHSLSEKIANL